MIVVERCLDHFVVIRWLKPYYPSYCFDSADILAKYLVQVSKSPQNERYDVVVGGKKAEGAVTKYTEGELSDLINIEFGAMDAWFEEDEQIFVHPKDPYKVWHSICHESHVMKLPLCSELMCFNHPVTYGSKLMALKWPTLPNRGCFSRRVSLCGPISPRPIVGWTSSYHPT